MTERPILFSAPMVRAILSGAKTQTRRIVTAPGWEVGAYDQVRVLSAYSEPIGLQALFGPTDLGEWVGVKCPYGVPGDRLWVRETWSALHVASASTLGAGMWAPRDLDPAEVKPVYAATPPRCPPQTWRPSIHMPRWASRITLEVTDVRVQRLQEISEEDAKAEGIEHTPFSAIGAQSGYGPSMRTTAVQAFEDLWDHINGKRAPWDSNPWVWAISFRRLP